MITGIVRGREARLKITFRLQGRPDEDESCVIDTGFTGDVILPQATVDSMGLQRISNFAALLADDSMIEVPAYIATIIWNDAVRTIRVLAMGNRPLVGMTLFDAHELNIPVIENGIVTVKELS